MVHYATDQWESRSPLVGFVVPKRQVPHAVDRHRVQRRLRHLVAEYLGAFDPGSRLVISVKAHAKDATGDELRACLEAGLLKVGAPVNRLLGQGDLSA